MSRGLWFAAGAGAGMYAVARARRVAEALSLDGLRDRVGAAVVGARMLREEAVAGHAERQQQLRQQIDQQIDQQIHQQTDRWPEAAPARLTGPREDEH